MAQQEYIFLKEYDIFGKKNNAKISALLYYFRSFTTISTSVEIIDCNRFKVLRKKHLVEQVLRQPNCKPFQFINHLN